MLLVIFFNKNFIVLLQSKSSIGIRYFRKNWSGFYLKKHF